MTLPAAQVVHMTKDRVRLRLSDYKNKDAFFANLEQAMAQCDGVLRVSGNPLTASMLIEHNTDLSTLIDYAQNEQLFVLQAMGNAENQLLNVVSDKIDQVDDRLKRLTGGSFDLSGLLFVWLLGVSLIQLLRGRVLGPASSLLPYAVTILIAHRVRRDT